MATELSGSGPYLTIANGAPFVVSTGWTISVWTYWDSAPNKAGVVAHTFDGTYLPMVMAIGNGGSEGTAGALYTGFFNGPESPNWKSANEGVAPPLGRWVHYAGRWVSGDGVYLFREGKQVAYVATASTPTLYSGTQAFRAGIDWTGVNFDGRLDKLAIWDRALPTERITYLSKNRASDPREVLPSSMIGYWRLQGATAEPNLAVDRGYSTTTDFTPTTSSTGLPSPWPQDDLQPMYPLPPWLLKKRIFTGGVVGPTAVSVN